MKWFPICVRNEIFADKWRNWVLTLNPVVFLASLVLIVAFSAIESRHAQAAEGAASNYFPGAYGSLLPGVAPEPGVACAGRGACAAGV